MRESLRSLAAAWPTRVASDPELDDALRFVADDPPDAKAVIRASYAVSVVVGVVAGVLTTLVAIAAGLPVFSPVVFGVTLGGLTAYIGRRGPIWLAAFRRTRALGAATTIVGLAAARMRLDPVPERAARFAAETADGPLAEDLARAVAGARVKPTTGLSAFAAAWTDWFPALDRATAALLAAADAPPETRDQTLDRAVAAVSDELEARTASFAVDLRGPMTGLYAFGVLLPLALVAAIPAATVAGLPVTPLALAVVYDLALPGLVVVAGARLTLARPVAFPPPPVATHPELPAWRRLAPLAGLAAGVVGWLVGRRVAPWAGPVAACGFAVGVTLLVRYRPTVPIRRRVRALERGLPDALALVGRRLAENDSAERALAAAGDRLPDPTGAAFAAAARRRRTLGLGLERAFRAGPLADTPSPRAAGVARLLAAASRDGAPAGTVLLAEADRLDTLQTHERRARRSVRRVTDTLGHTAALFGPLVAGATIQLGGRLADSSVAGSGVAPATLGPIVGGYVLWLAVLLPALAVAVERGFDRALVGYRVGIACCAATGSLLAGTAATGFVV